MSRIEADLRGRYVIGFRPDSTANQTQRRSLKVDVRRSGATVRGRRGTLARSTATAVNQRQRTAARVAVRRYSSHLRIMQGKLAPRNEHRPSNIDLLPGFGHAKTSLRFRGPAFPLVGNDL